MRVSIVVPRYLPHVGGVENHVAAVAAGLRDLGHSVTVATQLEGSGLPATEESKSGLIIRRFASVGRVRGQGLSPGLWRWVRSGAGRADLIHVHNYHALTSLVCAAAASLPLVVTPHYLGPGPGRLEAALHDVYAPVMRRALSNTARIICVSHSEAADFADSVGFQDRIKVIPNGVNESAIGSVDAVQTEGRLLVVAGRMVEYKQPQLALEALTRLPPEYHLAFIGDGPHLPMLRRRAIVLGLTNRTFFLGRQPAPVVYAWLRGADAVVSLSRRECFGMTLAEGLAAGAGVVASDIGAHRDVLEYAGPSPAVLVPTAVSPNDLARAIRAVSRETAATYAPRLPAWSEVAEQTDQLYRAIKSGDSA